MLTVRNISSSVALARDVDLVILDPEDVLKVLKEADEVFGNVFLRCCCYIAFRETCANGLLHPKYISQIDPGVLVDRGCIGARLCHIVRFVCTVRC